MIPPSALVSPRRFKDLPREKKSQALSLLSFRAKKAQAKGKQHEENKAKACSLSPSKSSTATKKNLVLDEKSLRAHLFFFFSSFSPLNAFYLSFFNHYNNPQDT